MGFNGRRHPQRTWAALVVLVLVAACIALVIGREDNKVRVTAHFKSVVGLYVGSEVRLMGVPIGEVTAVEPEGEDVRVDLQYDGQYELPAEAKAVIVSPSVIADRFVQLTPTFDGSGPVLATGAVIPLDRTGVPVELDRIYEASNDLATALGPKGANKDGALTRLLEVSADNLEGQGAATREMLGQLSGALGTIGATSGDFFETVDHLQKFNGTLAANDKEVRSFITNMESLTRFLAGEGDDLRATLGALAGALGTVETFIRTNRKAISRNVKGLARLTGILAAERASLIELVELAPLGLDNLNNAWDPAAQALRTRSTLSEGFRELGLTLCQSLQRSGVIPNPTEACAELRSLLEAKIQ